MKIIKWLNKYLEEVILVCLLACMMMIMGIQIFFRYVLNNSLTWSEELTRYLFIWSAFVSISFCLKKDISIKIDLVAGVFSKKGKKVLTVISDLLVIVFCIIMTYYSYKYLLRSIAMGQTSPACGIPMYIVQSAPFVGFILAFIRGVQKSIKALKGFVSRKEEVK